MSAARVSENGIRMILERNNWRLDNDIRTRNNNDTVHKTIYFHGGGCGVLFEVLGFLTNETKYSKECIHLERWMVRATRVSEQIIRAKTDTCIDT